MMLKCIHWTTAFHLGKIVILATVATFLILLLANAESSDDWRSSRSLCISDKDMCTSESEWYNSVNWFYPLPNSNNNSVISFCVRGSQYCVPDADDFDYTEITSVLGTEDIENKELATVIDENTNHTYFSCAFLIGFMCLISVCLTLLFDFRFQTVTQAQFLIPKDSVFMARVNLVLGVVITSLMIQSARVFSLMQSEKCVSETTNICAVLAANNLEIRSILRPADMMVTNYNVFCFSTASFLLVACIVSYLAHHASIMLEQQVQPLDSAAADLEMMQNIPATARGGLGGSQRQRGARAALGGWDDMNLAPYWMTESDPVAAAAQARCRLIMQQLKYITKHCDNKDSDCAICLNRLFLITPKTPKTPKSRPKTPKTAWADNSSQKGQSEQQSTVPHMMQQSTMPEEEDENATTAAYLPAGAAVSLLNTNTATAAGGSQYQLLQQLESGTVLFTRTQTDELRQQQQQQAAASTSNNGSNNSSPQLLNQVVNLLNGGSSNRITSNNINLNSNGSSNNGSSSGSSSNSNNNTNTPNSRHGSSGNVNPNPNPALVVVPTSSTGPANTNAAGVPPPPHSPPPPGMAIPSITTSVSPSSRGMSSPTTQDEIVQLRCGHEFHKSCILQWISCRDTCPVCRTILLPSLSASGSSSSGDGGHGGADSSSNDVVTDINATSLVNNNNNNNSNSVDAANEANGITSYENLDFTDTV